MDKPKEIRNLWNRSHGFTLVEMAVVLVIVGLMLGGLLIPLSAQIDQQRLNETRKSLAEIQEALIGFAIMHGRFPCPTTQIDPAVAGYGEEDAVCTAPAAEGYLPWKTLGLREIDSWGTVRTASGDAWNGYWRYRVHPNFSNSGAPFTLTTGFGATQLVVRNSAGNNLTTNTEPPLAIVYSTGKNLAPDGLNAGVFDDVYESDSPSPTFDDITVWISRPVVFNRMVAAGRLP